VIQTTRQGRCSTCHVDDVRELRGKAGARPLFSAQARTSRTRGAARAPLNRGRLSYQGPGRPFACCTSSADVCAQRRTSGAFLG